MYKYSNSSVTQLPLRYVLSVLVSNNQLVALSSYVMWETQHILIQEQRVSNNRALQNPLKPYIHPFYAIIYCLYKPLENASVILVVALIATVVS